MPSSYRSKSLNRRQKHVPLADDLVASGPLRTKSKKRKSFADEDGGVKDNYIDSRSSRKILRIGQELEDEDQAETKAFQPNPAFALESRFGGSEPESEEEVDERHYGEDGAWSSNRESTDDKVEIDPNDLDLFNKFNPSAGHDLAFQAPVTQADDETPSTNLADLILEKIAAHEAGQDGAPVIQGGGLPEDAIELPQKVIEVYTKYAFAFSPSTSCHIPILTSSVRPRY